MLAPACLAASSLHSGCQPSSVGGGGTAVHRARLGQMGQLGGYEPRGMEGQGHGWSEG